MTARHLEVGRRGEAVAEQWYRRRGYRLVARNWRTDAGEIDLVLMRGRRLVFCEVKTRSTGRAGAPVDAVDEAKQRRLRLLGQRFLSSHDLAGVPHRFDVVEVTASEVIVRSGVL